MTPETRIKRAIDARLRAYGPDVFVVTVAAGPFGHRGLPDRLLCVLDTSGRGRFVAVEVKSPRGRLTPLQRYTLNRIECAGGMGVVARSVEDVEIVVDRLRRLG